MSEGKIKRKTKKMISERKLLHTIGVARKCEQLAQEKGLSKEEQDACFVMGFLHDIGYEHCQEITEHPKSGAEMINNFLKNKNECVAAIERHGRAYENLSVYDEILNMADMTVNHIGEEVRMQERLLSIASIHGQFSDHYTHAEKQAKALEKEGM